MRTGTWRGNVYSSIADASLVPWLLLCFFPSVPNQLPLWLLPSSFRSEQVAHLKTLATGRGWAPSSRGSPDHKSPISSRGQGLKVSCGRLHEGLCYARNSHCGSPVSATRRLQPTCNSWNPLSKLAAVFTTCDHRFSAPLRPRCPSACHGYQSQPRSS